MAKQGLEALEKIKICVNSNTNFVLQGGAGSGKTETLKLTLEYISENAPDTKIACITHTNLAVDEIKDRVGEKYTISTIHSFLNSIIKDFKKNLHAVIHELFRLDLMIRDGLAVYDDVKTQNKAEHEKYKKIHEKYSGRLFTVKKEKEAKVEFKKIYDGDPEKYNAILNDKIDALNEFMAQEIAAKDHNIIKYNDTRFNSYRELTYGHDGLLDLAALLFETYPLLGKILQDKFDCIFIDEYQDTNEKIISVFLSKLPKQENILIGLFGDSMQAIYDDGIGDVSEYIADGTLQPISKEDNYRSSVQVKDFLNQFRYDDLKQDVVLKKNDKGVPLETLADRQGSVELYYSIFESIFEDKPNDDGSSKLKGKPHTQSLPEEKDYYRSVLDGLITKSLNGKDDYKQLKLTNRSIASDVEFENLFSIFDNKYKPETKLNLDEILARLQFTELFELCNAYQPLYGKPDYNEVLKKLKKQGFALRNISSKQLIKTNIGKILNSNKGAFETLELAFDLNLIKKSESHELYVQQGKTHLERVNLGVKFNQFRKFYIDDGHTFRKFKKKLAEAKTEDFSDLEEDDFNDLKRDVENKKFYDALFSAELKFTEVLNYHKYLGENTNYITMHKTKGGEIDNVLVVLDEYFWTKEYNFKLAFCDEDNVEKRQKNQRLLYVACSRAKTNLKCVRLVSDKAEAAEFSKFFDNVHEVKL